MKKILPIRTAKEKNHFFKRHINRPALKINTAPLKQSISHHSSRLLRNNVVLFSSLGSGIGGFLLSFVALGPLGSFAGSMLGALLGAYGRDRNCSPSLFYSTLFGASGCGIPAVVATASALLIAGLQTPIQSLAISLPATAAAGIVYTLLSVLLGGTGGLLGSWLYRKIRFH